MKSSNVPKAPIGGYAAAVLAGLLVAACPVMAGSKAAPAKAAAPAKSAPSSAARPAAGGGHPAGNAPGHVGTPGAGNAPGHVGTPGAGNAPGHVGTPGAGGRPGPGTQGTVGRPGGPGVRGGAGAGPHTPNGSRTLQGRNGNEVRMRPNGRPGDVHVAGRGMDIHHGLNGNRRVSVERADHSRVFAERGGRGYVQRPYSYRGHEFGHRTYYAHGRAYDRFYMRHMYHGVYMDVYAPGFYYAPAFYGWAYNPWITPVAYAWGWGAAPWYGYYGAYFTPYPVYPNASAWLTDYMISDSLAASYQAQAPALSGVSAMTPQVKDQIAAEVQRQIALENAEQQASAQNVEPNPASSSIQRELTDNQPHVFLVGGDLDVVDDSGTECAVTSGDALQLAGAPAPDATGATLTVLSNKGGAECRAGAQVTVALVDLQDMQNHMREVIDQGMGDLKAKQGHGGLPAMPASANVAPAKAPFVASAPPPEADVAAEINQQAQLADQAEKDTLGEVGGGGPGPSDSFVQASGDAPAAPPAPPAVTPTIGLGQSIQAITAAIGQPVRIVTLGTRKIYFYKDMKITFIDGKSTNIQ